MNTIILNLEQPKILIKRCGKCQQELSLDQFRKQRKAKLKKNSYCHTCILTYNKNRYLQNKEKGRDYMRMWRQKKKNANQQASDKSI